MSAEWLCCQTEKDASQDELSLSAAGAEDEEAEFIRSVTEKETVTGQSPARSAPHSHFLSQC